MEFTMMIRILLASLIVISPAYAAKITEMSCSVVDNGQRFNLINVDGQTGIQWDNRPYQDATIEFREPMLMVIHIGANGTFKMMLDSRTMEGYGQTRFSDGRVIQSRVICRW